MKPKIDVVRAVSARVARRALDAASIVVGVAFVVVLAGTWALAHFFSHWWWLLMVFALPLFLIGAIVMLLGRFATRRLAPSGLAKQHDELIDSFVDKMQALLETRGMNWPPFALASVKDLVVHRDLRGVKALIADTASLRRDFAELEERLRG